MKLFDKVKNLFTEEVNDEMKPIKKEVRHIEVPAPTRSERDIKIEEEEPEKKEEKFVFFSDDDFKDLERPKIVEKPIEKKEERLPYRGNPIKIEVEEKKNFTPSPIISPVYGVLDKNYSKEEIISKKVSPSRTYRSNVSLSVDDIRNKAYGTIEDELKDSLLGRTIIEEEKKEIVNDIDIFDELEKYDKLDQLEKNINDNDMIDVDDLFDKLDNKKEEILDELDNKKEEILDELDNKKDDIIDDELDDLDLDDETLELSKQLETQKRKLEEINGIIDEEPSKISFDEGFEETKSDNLDENELFDLIDSMYEKRDEE